METTNTFEVWEKFSESFTLVFPDNLIDLPFTEKQKCITILEEIFKTYSQLCNHLIPANIYCDTSLDHYSCFDSWLFGQLVRVFLSQHYETHKTECLEAQFALLRYIGTKNPFIFNSLIRSYLNFLQYLCDVASQENTSDDAVFSWFECSANMPILLSKVTFKVQNADIAEAANLILKIFLSQATSICDMCAASLFLVWRCCVKLMGVSDIDKSCCYCLLSLLVKEDDLPEHEFEFNPPMSELFLHIMNDIGRLCQTGKIREENDLCSMLNILCEYLRSDTCYDNSYINSIYCLIFQCQIPLNESTENTLLKFYSKLLRLSPDQTDIVNLSAEGNVQPINISLFAIALRNSIERQFEQMSNTSNLEISQSQKLWRCLIDQTNKYIQDVERKPESGSIKQTVALFKVVRNITQGAINISHRFKPNFTFFYGEIYLIVGGLTRIMERFSTKDIYLLLISIIRDILMLPETEHDDVNNKMLLLAFLTLPLRSFQLATNLPERLHDRLWDLMDDEIKINCITSLMYIRSLAPDYKYLLFNESFAMSGRQVFESLPVLIHHLTEEELSYFADYLLNADGKILTELSPFVEKIVCALDGRCVLTKLPENEHIELCCRTCDSSNFAEPIDSPVLEFRRRTINQLIFSVMSASEEAKLNVLRGAVQISNHICEIHYQDFLSLLHECFASRDIKVVEKMIQIMPHVLFKNIIDSATPLDYRGTVLNYDQFASYVKSLQEVLVTAVFNCDSTMQYNCIKCIDKIGCIPIEMTLFPCVSLLMSPMLLAPSRSSRLAKSTLEKIARIHDEDEERVYLKYRDNLFPLIKHLICVNFSEYRIKLWDLPFDYTVVFSAVTQRHILKYLLPEVVRHSYARKVVEELAEICETTVSEMLVQSFTCIFVHVMLSESTEMAIEVLKLIENETEKKVTDILGCCVARVLSDLLIHYADKRDQVRWSILGVRKLLAGDSLQDSESRSQDDDKTIANFVRNRFFGILMNLEAQLRSKSVQNKTRRQIISSLKHIIEMMGSEYITKVRFKVLFALRTITCSEKAEYPVQCVQLWDTFIKLIDREVLGPMLSTIFVSLAPLAEQQTDLVHNILRYLVVENRILVKSHLSDLYFVTSDQCDLDTFKVIKSAQPFASMTVEEKLNVLTKLSQNEIVEVKLHALKRLKEELSKHHKEISQLILASDTMNSLIPEIHRVLLEEFRNPDQSIQEAIGTCLGEFGAIDPSYIPNTVIKGDDAKKYTCYPIDDTRFVVDTLKVLGRGFQTAEDNSKMDQFALAIQTTLQTYRVRESDECKYWQRIPEKLREIIQPFFTTNYILHTQLPDDIPYLIYTSEDCTSMQYWARKWSNFLISLLGAETQERVIFHNIRLVISNDNECMLFFLPYILLKAIFSASESKLMKIYEEMISIIRDDRRSGPQSCNEEHSSTQLVVAEELQTMQKVAEQSMDVICAKTIFHLLDVLNNKCREMRATARGTSTPQLTKLSNFLAKFSPAQLAEKSFERNEYARSLLYMEEHLSQNEKNLDLMDKNLATLAKTYVYLNDVDNVKGLFAQHSRKLRQPQHAIMLHEITDQFQDAAICYQELLKDSDAERSLFYEIRMIRGYLSMNQPQMALQFAESLSTAFRSKASSDLYDDVKCEALWNLSKYQDLSKVTSTERAQLNDAWGVRIGQAVVHFLNNRADLLGDELTRIRKTLTKSLHLSSAGYGGYKECYDVVIKLHILNEFEKISEYVFKMLSSSVSIDECRTTFESLVKIEFEERLNKLQPVSRVLQPVLNIRQTLFTVARRLSGEKAELQTMFNEEIGKCWLKVIEIANRTRNFQLAYSNILAIDNYKLKGFFIEKAKYYWQKMEPQEALRTLKDGIAHHYSKFDQMIGNKSVANEEDRKICAEAMLLIGTYNDTMVMTDLITNLEHFQNAAKLYPRSEKILVKLAQYYDKITHSVPADDLYRTKSSCYSQMIKYYGISLTYGCEFIYQSLSRLINIWLDYASKLYEDKNKNPTEDRRKAMNEMNKLMDSFIIRLPAYYFCTAFSLIISRISHPVVQCFDKLHQIIVKCLKEYPNQMLWQFTSLHRPKLSPNELTPRVQKILNSPQLNIMTPFIFKFQQMFEQFSELCEASRKPGTISGATSLRILTRRKHLPLLNGNAKFDNDIMIPAQKFLTIILPRSPTSETPNPSYNPYPETMVYINSIRDEVHVYSSLQKPIRVNLLGTDGNEYVMIFKAYDDMRIDCRCVEFNSVVNMYLKRDVEARDRALRIRTYTVLPLIGNTGIIEFIPNLNSMRGVNMQMRRSFGFASVSVKAYECTLSDSMEKKLETFDSLVQLHPPLLHKWFVQEFPNPTSWYAARTAYTRSLAVMSVVGYILGLGDRHNDNILLDSNSGDVIHVDLNVIFNKGELLQWPERVPFRLTHSMIKAMGLLGYEGSFVCTSEIVNRILRERKEQLVSILHMFLYDPPSQSNFDKNKDFTPERNIAKVELRLNGCVTVYNKAPSIPLSVEGQTRKLIEEATNKNNLCQMFIGWSAFI